MVRSFLDSSLLQRHSTLRFALLFVGVCVMLGSVALWFGTADFDYHYGFDGQIDDVSFQQEIRTTPYGQLSPDTKRIVDRAVQGRSFTFENGEMSLPTLVSHGGTYYRFDARRVVDWLNPGSVVPVLSGLMGLWATIEAVQHERKHLGTRGR